MDAEYYVGKKYGKLTVDSLAYKKNYDKYFNCTCECGNKTVVLLSNLTQGRTKSCGCLLHQQAVNFIDRTGWRYGRLTCTDKYERRGGFIYWLCKCDCGKETYVRAQNLVTGEVKSCGCAMEHVNMIHGLSHTRLHNIWQKMNDRCFCKNIPAYKDYGGRGITVCDEWLGTEGFIRFYEWSMNNGYEEDLTIDRIDNNKGYTPDNCRWTTRLIQANNTRSNINITYKNETHTIAEWARIYNMNADTLRQRISILGWSFEDAITREVRKRNKNERTIINT